MRYELVDGQGNFGSVDDDPAAAMRYCVVGDTRVQLPGGTVRIADLADGLAPDSERDVDIRVLDRLGRPVHASRIFHSGEHPTLRLRTKEGYELTGTHNHPVLCLVDMAGVPLLLWKRLDELKIGDRVVMNRTPRMPGYEQDESERSLALLLGAFVSEGWASAKRAGFNNVDVDFFDAVVGAFDEHVGGTRYLNERTINSGSRLFELDVQNMSAFRGSPLASLMGRRSAEQARAGVRVAGIGCLQARFLALAFHGRWLVVAAASKHDPDFLFLPQRWLVRATFRSCCWSSGLSAAFAAPRPAASTRSSSPTGVRRAYLPSESASWVQSSAS